MKILLAVTGSVAATQVPKLYDALEAKGHEVKVIATEKASQLFPEFNKLSGGGIIKMPKFSFFSDKEEYCYDFSFKRNGPIWHIILRDWADVLLVAPTSANTMAKMANGLCDNLVTSVFRAWDFSKPVYIAPAMNTKMWLHPVTNTHISTLSKWGCNIIYPTPKQLECKEVGIGAMAHALTIADLVDGNRWLFPVHNYFLDNPEVQGIPFIPVFPHPGGFGTQRKHEHHTGVDIYTPDMSDVVAAEAGEIISIAPFTGVNAESPWWHDTMAVSVKGRSGIICYGEIEPDPNLTVGANLVQGSYIGKVKQVLKKPPKEKPAGHKISMLHIELIHPDYNRGTYQLNSWKPGEKRPWFMLDPTPYLQLASIE